MQNGVIICNVTYTILYIADQRNTRQYCSKVLNNEDSGMDPTMYWLLCYYLLLYSSDLNKTKSIKSKSHPKTLIEVSANLELLS